ncbi:MAG: hypothetical protein L6R41_005442 [Letrouitia leprolyta]|nr:MAG: hypothetical protein L6R41_005442 [Letrouitia leprolyta]
MSNLSNEMDCFFRALNFGADIPGKSLQAIEPANWMKPVIIGHYSSTVVSKSDSARHKYNTMEHSTAAFPVLDQTLTPPDNDSNLFLPGILTTPPSSNDWENFAYPIPNTREILKGRIFTSKPLRASALHFMIDGGLAQSRHELYNSGNIRLRTKDNPYTYVVPGCFFTMRSKVASGGKPWMTYRMMRDVFAALEEVLEKVGKNFEASFVLTDEDRRSWGHGGVWERRPEKGADEA